MITKIVIINGPNLNLLGKREPDKYGHITFEEYLSVLQDDFPDLEIEYFQSNVEGEIINKIHEVGFSAQGIILNAGGYTHTSVAIADAVAAVTTSVIEVHITNIYSREEFRQKSLISGGAKGVICGLGLQSYRMAVSFLSGTE